MFARLLILFITIPLIELFIFLTLGDQIGLLPTIGIIVVTGFLGAYLTKRQGFKALAKYQEAVHAGRLPHKEVVDGLMILVAGAVLLTPGFLTDAIGFALLLPVVRDQVRVLFGKYLKGRVTVAGQEMREASEPKKKEPDVITVEAEIIENSVPTQKVPD